MKLLLINYEFPPIGAGAATATKAMAHEFQKMGFEVTVLTASFAGLPREENIDGVSIRRVRSLRRSAHRSNLLEMASFVISAMLELPSLARRGKIEGCIVFFSIPCGPIALLGRWIFKIPYIVSLRGGDVPGVVPEMRRAHRFLQWLRRIVLREGLAIVANGAGLRALSEEADPYPVRVIPNGVDVVTFCPKAELRPTGGPFRFLFVGRFHEQKNLPYLLEQWAAVRDEGAPGFEIHMVGDGPLRPVLQEQAGRYGLDVTWHGWIAREKLPELYQSCHCLVNPSHYEGMPNVVLEAMACGLAVIASAIPGNDALVRQGQNGFLFPLSDSAVFRRALRELLENRSLEIRMGAESRRIIETEFSWAKVAQDYAHLFRSSCE